MAAREAVEGGSYSARWLETVPSHWEVARVDSRMREQRMLVDPRDMETDEVFLYSIPAIQESGDGRYERTEDVGSTKLRVDRPMLLVSKLNPRKGVVLRAGPREVPTVCSSEFVCLRPLDCDLRYAEYLFLSEQVRQYLESLVQSATRSHQRVNPADVTQSWVPWPPRHEQRAIASFLDLETEKIDTLIEKKRRLLELLEEKRTALITRAVTRGVDPDVPMKDSGVEWLGEIPEHWEVVKLKAVATVQTGLTLGKRYEGQVEDVPYLRVANVQAGQIKINTDEVARIEVPAQLIERYGLRTGDVLMTEGGDFDKLGRGHVWDGSIAPCLHQNHVFAVRTNGGRLAAPFLARITSSGYGRAYFSATAKQSTNLASTSATKVRGFPVPLPPVDEQDILVRWLDEQLARAHDTQLGVTRAISLLQEYRTALISAAVTGKIDVTTESAA